MTVENGAGGAPGPMMSELLSLFPAGSTPRRRRHAAVGGCRADELADEFGTPVLVVAEAALRARAREYVDELSGALAATRGWSSRRRRSRAPPYSG